MKPTILSYLRPVIAAGIVAVPATLGGFPPAPYYTLFGIVRNDVGQTLEADNAQIIALKGTTEVGRAKVSRELLLDQNYEINISIDALRSGTQLYSQSAVQSQGPFSLVVQLNGQTFYPIEVQGNITAGKGGERVRLDLTLGEDTDGDGLPDAWEMWQLYQAGLFPDEDGWALELIDRTGDFDGDGQDNFTEYLAGTFASDPNEKFAMEIKEKSATVARLEFFGITGKVYTIERSTDAKTWERIPFSAGLATNAAAISHKAAEVGVVQAFVVPTAVSGGEFYRLNVR